MVLQLSVSNLKGTYLPRDSIDSMLSALTVRLCPVNVSFLFFSEFIFFFFFFFSIGFFDLFGDIETMKMIFRIY